MLQRIFDMSKNIPFIFQSFVKKFAGLLNVIMSEKKSDMHCKIRDICTM